MPSSFSVKKLMLSIANTLFITSQYILPKKTLSVLAGKLANSHHITLKNTLITGFLKLYPAINMQEARIEDPKSYASFNDFFIRELKSEVRPIDPRKDSIISPVDALVSQYGRLNGNQLVQAKGFSYTIQTLFGGDESLAKIFMDGQYATLYLAPYHYHRVHLPLDGTLIQATYIPGQFFSVNLTTAQAIPGLYSRNERLVLIFETSIGKMAVILVGAMLVGSMKTVFDMPESHDLQTFIPGKTLFFHKGEEIAHFKMGSTVILAFPLDSMHWTFGETMTDTVKLGESIGNIV